MNPIQKLVAQRRAHEILAAGLSVEICIALGDRDGAARHQSEMYALIAARDAQIQQLEEGGGNFFSLAGDFSRLQDEARSKAT